MARFFPFCMPRLIIIYICVLLGSIARVANAQSDTLLSHRHTLMFWNVENAFWPDDDPERQDDDFTPQGLRRWNMSRLKQKLTQLTKGILAAGSGQPPMAVGLAEVEGDSVMRYWLRQPALYELNYRYVMSDVADARGIKTALLYQPTEFRLISHASHSIPMPAGRRATRQLLHVAGRVVSGDTLDLIVVHLPSQLGGARQSQGARDGAHRALMQLADSLRQAREHPYVVIMGDMNEAPSRRHRWWEQGHSAGWHNLMLPLERQLPRRPSMYGSHKYQGEWSFLDQFIVSESLLNDGKASGDATRAAVRAGNARSFSLPFMLTTDENYLGHRPKRAYSGAQYEGGVSDHLPILLDLEVYF